MTLLLIAVAGGLGALARFHVDAFVAAHNRSSVPLGTLTVNLIGSGLLGLIVGFVTYRSGAPAWAAVAGTGFLGGFTTFSSACVEGVRLLRARRWWAAVLHAFGGLVASVLAAWAGLWLMSL